MRLSPLALAAGLSVSLFPPPWGHPAAGAQEPGAAQRRDAVEVEQLKQALRRAEAAAEAARTAVEAVQRLATRVEAENEQLRKAVREGQDRLLKLTAENDKLRLELTQSANERDAALGRTETLLRRVQELELAVARLQGGKPPAAVPNNDEPNPPAANIEGKVEKVDQDGSVVQVSIGSDAGLQAGQTLEVYRLRPAPKYLGQIRIVSVAPDRAVGRVVRAAGGAVPEIRAGDEVASRLTPPGKE